MLLCCVRFRAEIKYSLINFRMRHLKEYKRDRLKFIVKSVILHCGFNNNGI